jgi:hypothetical protein
VLTENGSGLHPQIKRFKRYHHLIERKHLQGYFALTTWGWVEPTRWLQRGDLGLQEAVNRWTTLSHGGHWFHLSGEDHLLSSQEITLKARSISDQQATCLEITRVREMLGVIQSITDCCRLKLKCQSLGSMRSNVLSLNFKSVLLSLVRNESSWLYVGSSSLRNLESTACACAGPLTLLIYLRIALLTH